MKHRRGRKKRRTSQKRAGGPNSQRPYTKAVAILQKELARNPNSVETHRHLATAYVMREEHEKALFHLEKLRALDPEDTWVLVNLSYVYVELGRFEEGKVLATDVLEQGQEPNPEKLHYILGRAAIGLDAYDEALHHFQTARDIGIEGVDFDFYLGQTYVLLNEFDLAFKHLQAAIARDPERSILHTSMAIFYLKQGKIDEGEPYLTDALMLDPESPEAHLVLEMLDEDRKAQEQERTATETPDA